VGGHRLSLGTLVFKFFKFLLPKERSVLIGGKGMAGIGPAFPSNLLDGLGELLELQVYDGAHQVELLCLLLTFKH